ncbi:unnamed protein product [Phytophthora fragariaefolia]|uniref:Unnamed protein product n=1 Tax=Phytophthora fragariaefolia TaxID=1490495 RepID=A0A9W6XY47_9STRA|nr:unnamed protein product [Phytophthora fragariaefolia]
MSRFVKPITSDHDLIELSKQLNVRLDGILALPEIKAPLPLTGSYIILLRVASGTGHWVCINDGHYFDSMGVGPPSILGELPYNEKQYQGTYAEYCSPWCLLWLYAKQHNQGDLLNLLMI